MKQWEEHACNADEEYGAGSCSRSSMGILSRIILVASLLSGATGILRPPETASEESTSLWMLQLRVRGSPSCYGAIEIIGKHNFYDAH
ncbi:unnamed protein product [Amoebophrya sp. A25]|nr:unnamed protein product [Amoebophrya sp. A25]|eukprot:GSA25T00010974001.1